MMKRVFVMMMCMLLCVSAAQATILPAAGVDEDFQAWTGLSCTPGVVLCQSLTVLDARGDQGGRAVETLYYSGTATIPVIESWDGYAKIYYADGTKAGWVCNDYLLLDPAWYVCDADTQVYAYPDVMAPRVALLDAGTKLPILTEYEDGMSLHGWVCVSLRGAAGWIRKTPADTADETWFRPEMLTELTGATVTAGGVSRSVTDEVQLTGLSELLTHAHDTGGMTAGCPFTAELALQLADGAEITLALATDSCCVYRVDGRDYLYARHLVTEEGNPDNALLFGLFGMSVQP